MLEAESSRTRLAILGTGLMGGSFGMAALRAGLISDVVGYDLDGATAEKARAMGALTEVAASVEQAVSGSSFVVIAAPVGSIPAILESLAPSLPAGAVVTDVGSTKRRIVEAASRLIPAECHFIGGHPLAGSEKEGIEAADPEIYQGCVWFLTPTDSTDAAAYGGLVRLLSGVGARILSLDAERHDELVALTSHLPQVLSSALMGFAAQMADTQGGAPLVTAGGFRDMTRIAASNPDLWVDIIRDNRDALDSVLDRFDKEIVRVRRLLEESNWVGLKDFFETARSARNELLTKPGLEPAEVIELLVPVPDKPGVLAEVTTTLGEVRVNIEDIDIVHSPEGGRGTIHLSVNGEDAARRAIAALQSVGYGVDRG